MSAPSVVLVGVDKQGEPLFEMNLAAALVLSYRGALETDTTGFAPGAKARLDRFRAAVDATAAKARAAGHELSLVDAAFAACGGRAAAYRVALKSGAGAALDFVLDHCEASS